MPAFAWNETDFLEFFAVEPSVEDGACSLDYQVERQGLRLEFTVWYQESVVQASVFRGDGRVSLYTFAAYVRGAARLIDDKRGRYLEVEDCIIAPSRFWYLKTGDVFDRDRFPHSVTIHITVDPDIHLSFVNYESRT